MNSGSSGRGCCAVCRGVRACGLFIQWFGFMGAGGGSISFETPNTHDAPVQAGLTGAGATGSADVDRSAGRHPPHGEQMLTVTSAEALTGRASSPIMNNMANIARPPRRLMEDDVSTNTIISVVVPVKGGKMERRAVWRME